MLKKTAGYLYTSRVFLHAALHVVLIIFSAEYLHCDSQLNNKKTLLEIYIKGRGRTGRGRNASPFPFPFTSFDFLPHILKALIKFTPGQVGQLIMYYTP